LGVHTEPLLQLLETPSQLELPIPHLTRTEIHTAILGLNPKKSPGYDLITSKILQELPPIGIKYLTQLFSAILLHTYFPAQWKVAQIILILKPGKPPNALPSYRPISLLPLVSKVFEKLLLKRLKTSGMCCLVYIIFCQWLITSFVQPVVLVMVF
jgi:hypothetical protein